MQLVESNEADTAASHWERTQTDETVRCFYRYRFRGEYSDCPQSLASGSWHARQSDDSANSRSYTQCQGSCVHDVQVPKWVQKRKQVHPDERTSEDDYEQPRRAVKVVVNMKFSLVAVGTHWSVDFLAQHYLWFDTHFSLAAM